MTVGETAVHNTTQPKNILDWANLCRVVAIYGVVLLHSCGAFFYQYGAIPLGDWLSANFLDSIVRSSVPLFVMLSGALLLKPGIPPATTYNLARRIAKVLFPLLAWSLAYLWLASRHSGTQLNFLSILKQPAMYHLWFVYMIIGLYLLLPLFQLLFEAIRNRHDLQWYLLCVWLVITCVPVYWPLPILAIMQQTSLLSYGGYFILGAVIASSAPDRIPTSIWLLIFLVSAFVTFGLTWHFSEQAGKPVETAYIYFSPNVFVSAVAAFILFTRVQISGRAAKVVRWISDRSFIIYFVHVLTLESVRYNNFTLLIGQRTPVLITILMISIATFAISLIVAALIRLVPGSQRVFG